MRGRADGATSSSVSSLASRKEEVNSPPAEAGGSVSRTAPGEAPKQGIPTGTRDSLLTLLRPLPAVKGSPRAFV